MTTSGEGASLASACGCPAGKYQSTPLAQSCDMCSVLGEGYTSTVASVVGNGQTAYDVCFCDTARGWVNENTGRGCIRCPDGYEDDNLLCKACAIGKIRAPDTAAVCVACPVGSFSLVLGASACRSCQEPTIPAGVCLAGIPEISSGISLLAFDRFRESTTVRTILDGVTPLNGTATWQSGDKVTVHDGGTRGQNPVTLERTPAGSWSPANIDPVHQMHTVYEISTVRSGPPRPIMSFQWQTALTATALGAYDQTIGTGRYYLRKSRRNDGKIDHFTPMSVKLLTTNPAETAIVQYAA